MLNIQQIEALRRTNPQLYETLKRLAGASLGPNQGWSLDDQITDGTNFARVASSALTANQIDPTKPGVLMKGSVPPTWSGAFTYVSTTSSLTWSWSGLVIYRADGTTTAIPNGSAAITGLSAATTYNFYPYWDDIAGMLAWVAGGAGSPGYAQAAKTNSAAQAQALQGRIPLSQGAIVAATTSSGTGGGSGGGSGSCLRAGTMVLTKERGTVALETCKVGEHLRCPSTGGPRSRRSQNYRGDSSHPPSGAPSFALSAKGGSDASFPRSSVAPRSAGVSPASSVEAQGFSPAKNAATKERLQPRRSERGPARRSPQDEGADENWNEGWTRIVRLEVRDCDTFIRLHFSNSESLDVTPHHIFTLADGSPMRAERLCLSDILVGRFARLTLTKIEVISPPQRQCSVGAQHAVPGNRPCLDAGHPPRSSGSAGTLPADSSASAAPSLSSRARSAARFSQTADEGSAVGLSVEGRDFSPAESDPDYDGLQPGPAESAPWQKVTISCEPSHQFFAGRHSASILTHNYTFSS